MPSLNVFTQDAFGVVSLTDSVNKVPFVPGRAGQVVQWNERGIPTTSIMIEWKDGQLKILNPTPRGGPGETKAKDRGTARTLTVPHYQYDDGINADEVQNVRAFGTENELESVMAVLNGRMTEGVQLVLDPTLEFQRLGALKGVLYNQNGSVLYNLFTEFGVTQLDVVQLDLAASAAGGEFRAKCAGIVRSIADELGGMPFTGVHAFCGNALFDSLLRHKDVLDSYKGTNMAQVLRDGYVIPNSGGNKIYGAFEFGGIIWENYRGANGGTAMVHTDEAHIFPVGVPGLFRTVYAPADYVETVNTIGLPRYAKQWMRPNGKGIDFEIQSNPLSYCTRPRCLIKAVRTTL